MDRLPSLKYAHVERGRRFLLDGIPGAWEKLIAKRIRDRYISGNRLRLRLVEVSGEPPAWKLGQKIRLAPTPPFRVAHTTIYLDDFEAAALAALPAAELAKTRRTLMIDGHSWSVDEFHGPLTGLFLAEIDLGDDGLMPATLPFQAPRDVTEDDRFSGGELACTPAHALSELITNARIQSSEQEPWRG